MDDIAEDGGRRKLVVMT
jgi:hypothetical protein